MSLNLSLAVVWAVVNASSPPPDTAKQTKTQLSWLSASSEAAKAKVPQHVKQAHLKGGK